MRRQAIAVAAVACLATAACTATNPAETPAATGVATSPVTVTEPASTTQATAEPSMDETSSMKSDTSDTAGGTASAVEGGTEREVDLADQMFTITTQQAIDKGIAEVGDGIVHSIELDWSQNYNTWVYELNILVGNVDHDVDISADTGDVLDHEQDDTNDKEQAIDLDSPMTWETARDKALGVEQGRITSWKLEWDDNRTSYEFDVENSSGDETEVTVDVDTGEVRTDD